MTTYCPKEYFINWSNKGSAVARWRRRRRRTMSARRGLVRMKVKKLQTLIPGGRGLKPDRLFLRTADYILRLRLQVNFLQALSKIYHINN
ncbi:transcription factor PAR2 [Humulus lupulus]|uniref:transcription factor PAR2 n=1 Tax=Humulus lupulus TaxID=3486 RepID=UPI002B406C65|nr:transcription factor PAR2 [Humulus lupulus]